MGLADLLGGSKKDRELFNMLSNLASKLVNAAEHLNRLFEAERRKDIVEELRSIEKECDEIVHGIYEYLHQNVVTPIDWEDINNLAKGMDDIVDAIEACGWRVYAFDIESDKPMLQLSTILYKCTIEIKKAFVHLSKRDEKSIEKHYIEINTLENQADVVYRNAVVEIFKETDVKKILKHREIYQFLEDATDLCEDVANVFENIILRGT